MIFHTSNYLSLACFQAITINPKSLTFSEASSILVKVFDPKTIVRILTIRIFRLL